MNAAEKRDFLFRFVPSAIRQQLLFDDEALYSTTDQLTADKITRDLLRYISPSSVITDATACVGGNTYSFSQQFRKVNAIEKDPTRASYLKHNMKILGTQNVEVFCGDCLDLCTRQYQDVIFLDPPWGGPNYKRMDNLDLYLTNHPLADVCRRLAPYTTYIALKVPTNFKDAVFIHCTRDCFNFIHKNTQLRKMHLLLFKSTLCTFHNSP